MAIEDSPADEKSEGERKPARKGRGARYSDEQIGVIVDRELRQSLGASDSEIAALRLRNLQYYRAEAVGELAPPAVPDRSSIVATDVADTVESMLPSLVRAFAISPDAMECEPRTQQFAPQAKLASEYLRHIFWKRCHGFTILHDWFKDGLIQKVGFVKIVWDKTPEDLEESYCGLLPEQADMLLQDSTAEALEQSSETIDVQGQQVEVYDLRIKRQTAEGRCQVVPVPPEEMRIHPRARYGEQPLFIAQEYWRTKAELEAEGHDLTGVSTGQEAWTQEEIERNSISRSTWRDASEGELERFRVAECYIQLDQDQDGVPEWRRVLMIGDKVMEHEQANEHPFVWFCPIPMPHAFFGLCPADQAIEPQRLNTSLMRALLDNTYLSVNQRTMGVEGRVNLDDLLTNRPGGHVRVRDMQSLAPIQQPRLDASAWQMVEWSEAWRERRTGYTRYSQGLKADALSPQTAYGASVIAEKDDMRTELIARVAAESVRQMFEKLLRCMARYQDVADQVELFGQWMPIDPREWADGFHIRVNVGLGIGNRDKRAMALQQVLQIQAPLHQAGQLPPQAVVAAARKFSEAAGLTEVEAYFPDPPPPQPGQPPYQVQIAQMQQQADAQKFQAESMQRQQAMQAEHQLKMQEMQASLQLQASNDQRDSEREMQRAQLEAQASAAEQQNKLLIAQMQAEVDRYRADLDAQVKLAIAQQAAPPAIDIGPLQQQLAALVEHVTSPAEILRGPDGRVAGVRKGGIVKQVTRGPDGRATGVQ